MARCLQMLAVIKHQKLSFVSGRLCAHEGYKCHMLAGQQSNDIVHGREIQNFYVLRHGNGLKCARHGKSMPVALALSGIRPLQASMPTRMAHRALRK